MKHKIQEAIESLQKIKAENPENHLIGEDELLRLLRKNVKIYRVDKHIKRLKELIVDDENYECSISEAEQIMDVTRNTIYEWIHNGLIEVYESEIDRKIRIVDLRELLNSLILLENK